MVDDPELVRLLDDLERMPGVVAVALGGSRAQGTADAASDWDIGAYYRGEIGLERLERWGEVHRPGSWGRIMNGGAWLQIAGAKVDVLLRDLDVVDHWSKRALEGQFDVDGLLGYVAGIPTYTLLAEHAVAVVLRGALPPAPSFPERLAEVAPPRWRFCRDFTLEHARARARRGDVVGAAGHAARAVIEEAHARLCERRLWAFNEKRIVERADLAHLSGAFEADVDRIASDLREDRLRPG
jgi:hypothetical protein